jgi:hypothetical protein
MSTTKIKQLIENLPEKDVNLGYKFLEKRDFDSLKELVDSAIYKVKKSRSKHDINNIEKYINIDLDELNFLKAEVDSYVAQLHIMDEPDNFDIIENCELIDELNMEDYY